MYASTPADKMDAGQLADCIKQWGREAGFQAIGIADIELGAAEPRLIEWLSKGFHAGMDYMRRHGQRRARPGELVPGTVSVICARLDYHDASAKDPNAVLADTDRAYISRYALGRDYHKVMRARLAHLAQRIAEAVEPFHYRVFTDSAPVMEVELARKAALGWRGKHTLLLSRTAGSYFFLGEIFTDLPLPADQPIAEHCGSCARCIEVCPTRAIVAPYVLDAGRCISYLTIEHHGPIPEPLRAAIGNRVYGCDDCQLVCPWNRFAQPTGERDFATRHGLDDAPLAALFAWSRSDFEDRLAGSSIRRIGYERWLRNLAVGLGNAGNRELAVAALLPRSDDPSALVREHVHWALLRQGVRS